MRRTALSLAATACLVAFTATATARPLRLGVVSFYNPRIMYLKYQPLVDYLAEQTRRPWELVISRSYEETVQSLCDGSVDIAYLGPLTYVRAHERCRALPLVRLDTGHESTYRSLLMVRRDSTIAAVAALAGRAIGFGSPLSTSSHLVPRAMLLDAGLEPGVDLSCVYFGHHDRAARAVLLGEVAACGVRDIVGHRFEQRGLRVLAQSTPIPNFPLVVAPGVEQWLRDSIVRALVVAPAGDEAIRERMAAWDEELAAGFAIGHDDEYDGIRRLAERVFGPYYLALTDEDLRCGGGR